MTAGKYNTVLEKGARWHRLITWKKDDGTVVDLTGYTARMHLRRTADDDVVVLELTTANGRITLGGVLGTIDLDVDAAATTALPKTGKLVYDLELVAGGGEVTRLLEGEIEVRAEVTR